ncbi:hypothetical protein [Williamsia muralis]|uniref:hypothetical protein n=1 Tax=Williamsia marianensis TaxID=85044 RepID=UPI001402099F|nr:hypothetical protein [Williamsia marianensis]
MADAFRGAARRVFFGCGRAGSAAGALVAVSSVPLSRQLIYFDLRFVAVDYDGSDED